MASLRQQLQQQQAEPTSLSNFDLPLSSVVTQQPRERQPLQPSAIGDRNEVDLRAAIDAARRKAPPIVAPGPLRTRSLLASLGPDAHRPGRTQMPGEPSARVFLRETVFDTLVDSLRHVDPEHMGVVGAAGQLHNVVAAAAKGPEEARSNMATKEQ